MAAPAAPGTPRIAPSGNEVFPAGQAGLSYPAFAMQGRVPTPKRRATTPANRRPGAAAAGGLPSRSVDRVRGLVDGGSEPTADEVLEVQRSAGNQAVVSVVQRRTEGQGHGAGAEDQRPAGPNVRAALQAKVPGVLAALSPEQLAQWQGVVDYYAGQAAYQKGYSALQDEFAGTGGGDMDNYDDYIRDRQNVRSYDAKLRHLRAGLPEHPAETLSVDTKLLVSDEVMTPPEFDVDAEMAFRKWALDRATSQPAQILLHYQTPLDADIVDRDNFALAPGLWANKGFITTAYLTSMFPGEYKAQVTDRPVIQELRSGLVAIQQAIDQWRFAHETQIAANRDTAWVVRRWSEALGEGLAELPDIEVWDESQKMTDLGSKLLGSRRFEVAVAAIEKAEAMVNSAAFRVDAYQQRIMGGAQRFVKGAGYVKWAGTVAAGIATGGLGLTGSALAAGGYTILQEGAQQASEMAHGLRSDMGWGSLAKQGATSALMAVVGGALQARFTAAWAPRLAGFGAAGERIASMGAAATSSFYTTGADLVLKKLVDGQPFPSSIDDLCDDIIGNAIKNAGMDVALHDLNARAKAEYELWKSTGTAPAAEPATATEHQGPAAGGQPPGDATPGTVGAKGEPAGTTREALAASDPRAMSDGAVHRLLTVGGGFDQLSNELRAGTGLGLGMPAAERQALLDRFQAHREVLARQVASLFDGQTAVIEGSTGQRVEVVFGGPDAPTKLTQAKDYLDTKSPGWEKDTAVELEAPAVPGGPARQEGLTGQQALEASTNANARARIVAEGMAPIFDEWDAMPVVLRRARFAEVLNEQLVAVGAPEIAVVGDPSLQGTNALFRHRTWEVHVSEEMLGRPRLTPADFAELCGSLAHERTHAVQFFRGLRTEQLRSGDLARKTTVRPDVVEAAQDANEGRRPAEVLTPDSLAYAEARDFFESFAGSGRSRRNAILKSLDRSHLAVEQALRKLAALKGEPVGSDRRAEAATEVAQARQELRRIHELYLALPEESAAWRSGIAVEKAVAERMAELLTSAQQAEARAFAEYQNVEDTYLGATQDPQQAPDISRRQREWEGALEKWRAASAEVERLTNPPPRTGAGP
jgi:hypothetical protein